MATPDASFTIQDGGLGISTTDDRPPAIVLGCSSGGASYDLSVQSDLSELVAAFGRGPLVQAAALHSGQVIVGKLPTGTPGSAGSVTPTGSGTSVMTVTGTPYDSAEVRVRITRGATLSNSVPAEFAFQYSLDGSDPDDANGGNWSGEKRLSGTTPLTYAITELGISLVFSAGTVVVGGSYAVDTVEPLWSSSNFAAMVDAIAALPPGQDFSHILLVGKASASAAAALETLVAALSDTQKRYCSLIVNTRDFENDSQSAWKTSVAADYATTERSRLVVGAGHMRLTNPLDSWARRRPIAWAASARAASRRPSEMVSRRKSGAIANAAADANGVQIYHDERTSPGLDAARFLTTRTVVGRVGPYFTNDVTMAAPGSDYSLWPNRRVMDRLCKALYPFFADEVNDSVVVDRKTGFILEKEARDIEARANALGRDTVIATGDATAVRTVIRRDLNILSTRKFQVAVKMIPLGYKQFVEVTLGFENPALVAV